MAAIKFQAFRVVNADTRESARVHYSLDNRGDKRECVKIYDRDYGNALAKIFDSVGVEYRNDTDITTDYFDKGAVTIFPGHEIYAQARAAVEQILAKEAVKRDARHAKRVERANAKRAALIARTQAARAVIS